MTTSDVSRTDAPEKGQVEASSSTEAVDLTWVPAGGDEDSAIAEYYEAESWQFSGCGD